MIKAVLFDLWGTLAYIENLETVIAEEQKLLGSEGYRMLRDILFSSWNEAITTKEFVKRVSQQIPLEKSGKELIALSYEGNPPRLFSDVLDILNWLKHHNYKIGIVSNSVSTANAQLDLLGIRPLFDCIILSCEIGLTKPNAEAFDLILQKLHITPNETVMIGDKIYHDMGGAKNAGIRGILIDRQDKFDYPDKIHALTELKDML